MPNTTIAYAATETKCLNIKAADWNQQNGYTAQIKVFLGEGTDFEPASALSDPKPNGWIRCEALFTGAPRSGLPLPLQIGDVVQFEYEGADIRIKAVLRNADAAPYFTIHYHMPINVLFAAHSTPPVQPAVGNAPIDFLNTLPAGHYEAAQFEGYDVNDSLTREEVREICTNQAINPLAAYAVAMAWGGQNHVHFTNSIVAPGLIPLLETLRLGENSRSDDFAVTAATAEGIPGLGIAFYTKLLYFFRPNPDAYILDQWTAKSACILFNPCHVRLGARGANGYFSPAPDTTPAEYEAFCLAVDGLANVLWPGIPATGAQAEAAMFDEGRNRGMWRVFIKDHFVHQEVGDALRAGARCLTTAQDFDDGLLIIEKSEGVHVYLRPDFLLTNSTRWGTAYPLNFLRILLARMRQLGATKLYIFADANGLPLPPVFINACELLGVEIIGDAGDPVGVRQDEPPNPPLIQLLANGGVAGNPPATLRQLIHDRHIAPHQQNMLRDHYEPDRVVVTARPHMGNANIRWQYHLQAHSVRINLYFTNEEAIYNNVRRELIQNSGPALEMLMFNEGANFNIALIENVPTVPNDLPATADACVEAMQKFYEMLLTNSQTVQGWEAP